MAKTKTEIEAAIAAQRKACADRGWPHFAPMDGICFCCHQQIYELRDGKEPITGCPHCFRTFCD